MSGSQGSASLDKQAVLLLLGCPGTNMKPPVSYAPPTCPLGKGRDCLFQTRKKAQRLLLPRSKGGAGTQTRGPRSLGGRAPCSLSPPTPMLLAVISSWYVWEGDGGTVPAVAPRRLSWQRQVVLAAPGDPGGGSPETPCPLQWVLGPGVQSVLMGVAYWSQENL